MPTISNRLTVDEPEGLYAPTLASIFYEASEAHEKATIGMIQAQKEMDEAKDMMEVASAQVELQVIQDAGGVEKKVGGNEDARTRMYNIARSKSTHYLSARDHYYSARSDYKYHQMMVRRLDLRLQFIVATVEEVS